MKLQVAMVVVFFCCCCFACFMSRNLGNKYLYAQLFFSFSIQILQLNLESLGGKKCNLKIYIISVD